MAQDIGRHQRLLPKDDLWAELAERRVFGSRAEDKTANTEHSVETSLHKPPLPNLKWKKKQRLKLNMAEVEQQGLAQT